MDIVVNWMAGSSAMGPTPPSGRRRLDAWGCWERKI
jgi:hypothetical protein